MNPRALAGRAAGTPARWSAGTLAGRATRAAAAALAAALLLGGAARAETFNTDFSGKRLDKEVVVAAPVAAVWTAWTDAGELTRFFAPKARIELRPGGAYEPLFQLDAPEGSRGCEGCTVLAWLPEEMLAFSWNAPPKFPHARGLHTFVVLRFERVDATHTRVRLAHLGFGRGAEWDDVYAYFDRAWSAVLASLAEELGKGAAR